MAEQEFKANENLRFKRLADGAVQIDFMDFDGEGNYFMVKIPADQWIKAVNKMSRFPDIADMFSLMKEFHLGR